MLAAFVVRGVLRTVGVDQRRQPLDQIVRAFAVRCERHEERTDSRPEEMVWTGCAATRQLLAARRTDELEHGRRVDDVHDLRRISAQRAAQRRRHDADEPRALRRRERGRHHGTERIASPVRVEPVRGLLNDGERRLVAAARRVAPRNEPVAAENEAVRALSIGRRPADRQAEIEPRALPGNPADGVAEDLRDELAAAPCSGERDDRVRVHVIDVPVWNERVQRRVDAGRARVQIERAMRKVRRHLVFVLAPAVDARQPAAACPDRATRSRRAKRSRGRRPIP